MPKIGNNFAFLQKGQFQKSTGADMRAAASRKLQKKHGGKHKKKHGVDPFANARRLTAKQMSPGKG